jgi:hypothetical protein
MTTAVATRTASKFDLSDAVANACPVILEAFPDWTAEDLLGLKEAIRHDAAAFVAANVPDDCPSIEDALALVESRMFESFLDNLAQDPSAPGLAEPATQVPTPGTMIDLTAEIGEAAPFLDTDQRRMLAGEVYPHIEKMVGEALTEGMADDLLDEFGCFVEQDVAGMEAWFAANLPDFEAEDDFQKLVAANPDAEKTEVMSEFGAMRWLAKYQPEYPQVVARQMARLKAALADLVAQAGEDAIRTWARVQGKWARVVDQAVSARGFVAGAARLVDHEGADAVERWASVQTQLCALNERAASLAFDGGDLR